MLKTLFRWLPLACLLAATLPASAHAYGTLDVPRYLPWQVDAQAAQAQVALADTPSGDTAGQPIVRLQVTRAPCHLPNNLQDHLGDSNVTLADLLGSELRSADYVAMRTFIGLHDGDDVEVFTLVGKATARWSKLEVEIDVRHRKIRELRYMDAGQSVVRRLVCGRDRPRGALGSCMLYSDLPHEVPASRLVWVAPQHQLTERLSRR